MNKGKVLLIDDNPDMISIGEQIFVRSGYQYFSATSGKDGLAQINLHYPDVVILDYLLPDMKAHELIEEVFMNEIYKKARSIPFVVLTAWEEEIKNIGHLFNKGLKAYLTKPFGHRELRCVIENIIALSGFENGKSGHNNEVEEPDYCKYDEEITDLASSIVGLSKILLDSLDGELSQQQQTDLIAIYNCGKKLIKKFANDLKDGEAVNGRPFDRN